MSVVGRVVREGFSEEVTFVAKMEILIKDREPGKRQGGKSILGTLGRGKHMCKGPEAGRGGVCCGAAGDQQS